MKVTETHEFYNSDLNDAYSIVDLLRVAYEAGKAGEIFDYEFIEKRE